MAVGTATGRSAGSGSRHLQVRSVGDGQDVALVSGLVSLTIVSTSGRGRRELLRCRSGPRSEGQSLRAITRGFGVRLTVVHDEVTAAENSTGTQEHADQ